MRAYWLQALAFIGCGRSGDAICCVKQLERLFPSDTSELGHLRMKALFPLDSERAVIQGIAQFRGWRDEHGRYWTAKSVQLVKGSALPRERGFVTKLVGKKTSLQICSTIVYKTNIVEYTSELHFAQPYINLLDAAIILPLNCTILANDKYIIEDSSHHRKIHLDIFTPNIRSLSDTAALVCMPEPDLYPHDGCIVIGNNANYYHWIVEALPRLKLVKESEIPGDLPLLVDKNVQHWQIDLLERFGICQSRLRRVDFSRPLKVRNLVVPSLLSTASVAHPDAVNFVRKTLLREFQDATPKRGKRLYLTRASVPGRAMLNAKEIEQKFRHAGFQIVDPSSLNIQAQIELFHDAEFIAGPAGAGLTNTIFAPVGAKLLQLGPIDVAGETYTLATAAGQTSCWCFGSGLARTYPRWIWTNFDFRVDFPRCRHLSRSADVADLPSPLRSRAQGCLATSRRSHSNVLPLRWGADVRRCSRSALRLCLWLSLTQQVGRGSALYRLCALEIGRPSIAHSNRANQIEHGTLLLS